jgi:UDP-N-acetylglucosamine:LPS N-acetylglucosamine transferase
MKICLVCSSGGHFFELFTLNSLWEKYDHFWVTFASQDTKSLLRGERVHWAYSPTNRNLPNLLRNSYLAAKVIAAEKPTAVVSTGAGVAVPFLYLGRLLGLQTVYVESLARIRDLSLTGRLVYPVVHDFLVQWPELATLYPRARFQGHVA